MERINGNSLMQYRNIIVDEAIPPTPVYFFPAFVLHYNAISDYNRFDNDLLDLIVHSKCMDYYKNKLLI